MRGRIGVKKVICARQCDIGQAIKRTEIVCMTKVRIRILKADPDPDPKFE
jgi:hypothetical protein